MRRRFLVVVAIVAFSGLQGQANAQSLGTAESFAVLGGSTVTNTGSSIVNGDLGVWPGLAITGFPPGIVVPPGTIHPGDAVAQQAQSDVTTAYLALAGMACNSDLTSQDLGGLTLTPGVYCFSSSAQLTGNLTLNALGNGNALFVFQIGSTITTASNSSVLLTNGAQPCNVSWQVGTSATLGTNTAFVGNILALTSITLTTGADVSGRALARNGAVTMDTNNVSINNCLPCDSDTDCPSAVPFCNAATGMCVQCLTDGDCDDGLF
ncbi:MAG: ice-binding family protein, partial [Planctomycetota bacterium]